MGLVHTRLRCGMGYIDINRLTRAYTPLKTHHDVGLDAGDLVEVKLIRDKVSEQAGNPCDAPLCLPAALRDPWRLTFPPHPTPPNPTLTPPTAHGLPRRLRLRGVPDPRDRGARARDVQRHRHPYVPLPSDDGCEPEPAQAPCSE